MKNLQDLSEFEKKFFDKLFAEFIKKWTYQKYGKRYIGADNEDLRFEGMVIDLTNKIKVIESFLLSDRQEVLKAIIQQFDRKMLKTKGENPNVACWRTGYNARVKEEWEIITNLTNKIR